MCGVDGVCGHREPEVEKAYLRLSRGTFESGSASFSGFHPPVPSGLAETSVEGGRIAPQRSESAMALVVDGGFASGRKVG